MKCRGSLDGTIARIRESNGSPQYIADHLHGTSELASLFAGKVGMSKIGELLGLLHDIGKYAESFQNYLKSAEGLIEPDDDDYVNSVQQKGKIDHSTAGAQFLWRRAGISPFLKMGVEMMALCIASHHTGLMNVLSPIVQKGHDDNDLLTLRMKKTEEKAHTDEVTAKLDASIQSQIDRLLISSDVEGELRLRLEQVIRPAPSSEIRQFMLGFLTRFLFSALVDADRLNSAERTPNARPDWSVLQKALETHLAKFSICNTIDQIRADISAYCDAFATRERGLYQLTVPTGGGKTLASLRFALRHAALHKMDRVIYVVPYTSIIDQNAQVARKVFAEIEKSGQQVVLEHHANLTPELDTNQSKMLSENWDAPIIYTTAVQLLETLFGAGTRGVRRLHQLANAIIIFDEVQTIPIRTVHLFNNAVNFLVHHCASTVVLCTATQPLLDKVDPRKGAMQLSANAQMMPDVDALFKDLYRAHINDLSKPEGWSGEEVAELALRQLKHTKSILIIVNKKAQARELFRVLSGKTDHLYHLSTSMCPNHRMDVLGKIKACLDVDHPTPVICISTQLIEAGVDVDFGTVIRYLAGLDSIAQAAGRCNRNGVRPTDSVLIVNPRQENLDNLPDIRMAKEVTERILHEYHTDPARFDDNLQSPAAMARYYEYFFFKRAHEMTYPLSPNEFGRNENLFSLLSTNVASVHVYQQVTKQSPSHHLRQSFMSAGQAFKAIDTPTEGVVVPYSQDGEQLIAEMTAASPFANKAALLRRAQRFSVNLFPHEIRALREKGRLREVWAGSGVLYLDERHYDNQFGVSLDEVAEMKTYIV